VPDEVANNVLWEVSDACRVRLVGSREPSFEESQVNAFELKEGRLHQVNIASRSDLDVVKPIWIDLINATRAERAYVGTHFGLALPDPGEVTDLEVSSRFHIEDNGDVHLHSNFLLDRAGSSRSIPVAFILHQGTVVSQRSSEENKLLRLETRI
jgi:magnesium transporter